VFDILVNGVKAGSLAMPNTSPFPAPLTPATSGAFYVPLVAGNNSIEFDSVGFAFPHLYSFNVTDH
jgi:hypothetical protein